MNPTRALLSLFLIATILTGCVSQDMVITPRYAGPDKVPVSRMAAHMQYRGFAILKPEDMRWYSKFGEQSSYVALFRFEPLSDTHTFFASVRNTRIAISPRNVDEFKSYVDTNVTRFGPRYELISYESRIVRIQGQLAIHYKVKFWDKAAQGTEEPLVTSIVGFDVIHPAWDRTVISASYSQRGKKDELSDSLDKAGEDFLSRIVLESSPGVKIDG